MNHDRFSSLDLFRGITVALMFLVNLPGSFDHVFGWLDHAEWHGLTAADFIFPWFLLCVGAATPFAIDARRADGLGDGAIGRTILWRGLMLFAIGVVLGWILRPRFTLDEIRIAGVLQRIALVYLATAGLYLLIGARALWLAIVTAMILIISAWALLALPVPGYGPANLDQGTNLFAWLDQHYLPGRLFRKTWDPEGIGGTVPAIGSALIGVIAAIVARGRAADHRWQGLMLAGAALTLAGLAASHMIPFNKNLWSSSFVLITAGAGLCVWGGIERARWRSGFVHGWALTLGQTALTAYIVHWMLLRILIIMIGEHWLGTHIFGVLSSPFADPRVASLLIGLVYVTLSIAPMKALKRKNWLIRV